MTKHDRIRSRQDVPTQELYRLCLWRIRAFIKGLLRNKNIEIPEQLQQVQNLERFDYVIWRDLLEDLNRLNPKTGLGLEIAEHVQPKHLGIIAYLALSCENLGEALARYHDFHRLIYDGSPLVVEFNPPYASIRWEAPEPNPTQLTDEIAIALMVQFHKLFLSGEDLNLHEVHFVNTAPKTLWFMSSISVVKSVLISLKLSYFYLLPKPLSHFEQATTLYSNCCYSRHRHLWTSYPTPPNSINACSTPF